LLFISGLFLLYSAVVVPFQICMWDYSDPCNLFPTLQLDLAVDTFFLVIFLAEKRRGLRTLLPFIRCFVCKDYSGNSVDTFLLKNQWRFDV
jgi:hypothetical protein